MSIDWTAFVDMVSRYSRFVLTSHVRPDCDALGSELGMARILEAVGKQVRIVNPHPTPPNLTFIDPEQRIETIGSPVSFEDLADRELLMILDTSAWAQLGEMADVVRRIGARKIVLDHHVSEDDLGAELFKDTQAEATGRLVFEAARHLGVPIDERIATPLFAALATDTGWFRFPSTRPVTFACAGELVRAGAQPAALFSVLYEQDTLPRMHLRGLVLSRIRTERGGRLAHTYIALDDFRETGAVPSDTEDLVNAALGIIGVEVAAILVEQSSGKFKISLRSRGPLNCNAVAATFGGGGHKAAAGAMLDGPLADARQRLLNVVLSAMS